MDERSYTDFDLVIEQVGERYRARVVSSPAGQASVEFDSLFSPLELENFVLRMGRPQKGMRRIDSSEMETVRTFGTRLFKTVFKDDVYACYLRSLDEVLDQSKGLRIRLRIDVPQFHDLPWEYLYNPQIDQFLALSKDTPIIRYIELPYRTQAQVVKTPMKILVMISSPAEYPPLDVEEEWNRLNRALQPLIDQGVVELDRLEKPTLGALQQHLRQKKVHIFHFIGHGKYFEQTQDGVLLLEDGNHHGIPTSGQQLGAILHDHHSLQLAVLNACEGARTSAEDPYTGVAQTLVRQGIPAVLAMQFEIFEKAAVTLAQEFYGAIADGYPVDAALSEARKAIFASNNDVEWGTPVLFMRIPNGVLFKPQTPAEKAARLAAARRAGEKAAADQAQREAEAKKAAEAEALLLKQAQAEQARAAEQAAIEQAQRAVEKAALEKAQREAEAKKAEEAEALRLKQAQAEQERAAQQAAIEKAQREAKEKEARELAERAALLADLYDSARELMAVKDWPGAIASLAKIRDLDPAYRDVAALLRQADIEKDRAREAADLLSLGKRMAAGGNWQGAAPVLQQALDLAPDHAEAQSLLAEANTRIEQERQALSRQTYLAGVYEVAADKMAQKDWARAIESLEMLEQSEPGYRDVKSLLEQARMKKEA
ncbi:MAG TPA: CHAT domain-containing protein, partial [Anaerolineales bacterium]